MFILDPSGNALEFKSFRKRKDIFDHWNNFYIIKIIKINVIIL